MLETKAHQLPGPWAVLKGHHGLNSYRAKPKTRKENQLQDSAGYQWGVSAPSLGGSKQSLEGFGLGIL